MNSTIDINIASNEIVVVKIIEGKKIIPLFTNYNRNTTYSCGQETIEKFG